MHRYFKSTHIAISDHVRTAIGRKIYGHLKKKIQTAMAQGRPTKITSMIKWMWTSRLSVKITLSQDRTGAMFFVSVNVTMSATFGVLSAFGQVHPKP